MKKFVRIKRPGTSPVGATIPIDSIVAIRGNSAAFNAIDIITSVVTNPGAAPELLTYVVTIGNSPAMAGPTQSEAVADVSKKITDSYTKSWTNPLLDITEVFDGSINRTVGNAVPSSVAL